MQKVIYNNLSEEAMLELAASIASRCLPGTIIYLHGDLGAGKTTFVRGFLRGLGYWQVVKSPTYTLVEPYQLDNVSLFHFDLYRLKDPAELEWMGIQDYFTPLVICLIEWPEQGAGWLPEADLSCYIDFADTGRDVKFVALSEKGKRILQ